MFLLLTLVVGGRGPAVVLPEHRVERLQRSQIVRVAAAAARGHRGGSSGGGSVPPLAPTAPTATTPSRRLPIGGGGTGKVRVFAVKAEKKYRLGRQVVERVWLNVS